jgi:hypothetical protein
MNYYSIEFLAREHLDQLAREARAADVLRSARGTEASSLASIVALVRRLTHRPRVESPSGSATTGPHIA